MNAVSLTLIAVASVAIVATVLPLIRADAWWIRIFDFPRLQIAAVAIVALGGFLWWDVEPRELDLAFILALAASLVLQGVKIFPYTPIAPREVQQSRHATPEATVCLLLVNVLMQNRNADRLLELVRREDPDVLLAVETDPWWATRLEELAPTMPNAVQWPLENTYGMVLRSRLELVDPRIAFLVQDDVPSAHLLLRLASGDGVELHGVHPRPPSPTEAERSTERDAELLVVGKQVKDVSRPVIVAGDLNDVAWSRTTRLFQRISGLLDPRRGRGLYSTFHAKYPLLRWPLDHVFHSAHFRLVRMRRLPKFGSDHFPVLVVLSLEPDAPASQDEPKESAGDRAEAEQTIRKAGTN